MTFTETRDKNRVGVRASAGPREATRPSETSTPRCFRCLATSPPTASKRANRTRTYAKGAAGGLRWPTNAADDMASPPPSASAVLTVAPVIQTGGRARWMATTRPSSPVRYSTLGCRRPSNPRHHQLQSHDAKALFHAASPSCRRII
jgi:hypothetical protein